MNHETDDGGRSENLAAIPLTLQIRHPVGNYFECAKTLEPQESSACDQIEVIAASDTAESFTGSHPRRNLEYLGGDDIRQRSLTPAGGSRLTDEYMVTNCRSLLFYSRQVICF
jgi:hypothetical protein